jgi:hypothetical protein
MKAIISIILLVVLCKPLLIEASNGIITLDLNLLEMSQEQSIELNLAMQAKLVGRKECECTECASALGSGRATGGSENGQGCSLSKIAKSA